MRKKFMATLLTTAMALSVTGLTPGFVAGAAELEECTIEMLVNATSDDGMKILEEIAAIFNEKYPQVTVEFQNAGTDYYSVLATRINAEEVPDLFITMGYKECDQYSAYIYDLAQDEELMELVNGFDQNQIDCVYDSNGKVCGIPTGNQSYGYVYNKDLFEQAGIESTPKTLDELREACEKLEAAGITPFANGYKEWWIYKHSFSSFVGESFGMDVEKMKKELTDGTITFSELDKMNDMFDLLDLTLEYGIDKQMEMDASVSSTAFANGEAAMSNQGNWQYGTYISIDPDINVGFFPEPVGNDASLSKLSANVVGTFSISNTTEHFDAVKEFYKVLAEYYLTNPTGVNLAVLPHEKTDMSLIDNALSKSTLEAENTRTWSQNWWPAGFETDFGTLLQEYSIGNMTREEVLIEMQNSWDNLAEE